MQFKDIPGHHRLKAKLIASVAADKVAQAIMLLGPEGNGSLPLAMAYATYLNCTDKLADDSCGVCSACNKSLKSIHPDIHYTYPVVTKKAGKPPLSIDYIEEWRQSLNERPYMNTFQWLKFINAENKQGNITVDECKDIIRNQSLKAYEASYKVQIIWMAEHLKGAGNVLLKIIEEPPPKTVFILIVEQQEQILNTILSRTQVIKVGKFEDADISNYLIQNYELPAQESERISRLADGNINAALQLIKEDETINDQLLLRWIRLLLSLSGSPDRSEIVELSDLKDNLAGMGRENQKIFLRYVLFFLRECLMIAVGQPTKLKDQELDLAGQLASQVDFETLSSLSKTVNSMHYYIERNANPRILFFNSSLKMARIIRKTELAAL